MYKKIIKLWMANILYFLTNGPEIENTDRFFVFGQTVENDHLKCVELLKL